MDKIYSPIPRTLNYTTEYRVEVHDHGGVYLSRKGDPRQVYCRSLQEAFDVIEQSEWDRGASWQYESSE